MQRSQFAVQSTHLPHEESAKFGLIPTQQVLYVCVHQQFVNMASAAPDVSPDSDVPSSESVHMETMCFPAAPALSTPAQCIITLSVR